jgi:hypothetical protein
MKALKACGLSLDLFGELVIAHLVVPRSIHDHTQKQSSLSNWGFIEEIFVVKIAKSSTQAAEQAVEVQKL